VSETTRLLSLLPDGHGRLTSDSRSVRRGDVFCAFVGTNTDGRDYIESAITAGACAVLVESDGWREKAAAVPIIKVENLRRRYSFLVEASAGRPSSAMRLIGVTGTNGKTSTAMWIAQALDLLGEPCGVIGTLGAGQVNDLKDVGNTTPDAAVVASSLNKFLRAGCKATAMEVSSHALEQYRVDGFAFQVGIFTNLTRDHLDYHGTMEAYASAKARLFGFATLRWAIINADDLAGERMAQAAYGDVVRYSPSGNARLASVAVTSSRCTRDGIELTVNTPRGEVHAHVPVLGTFNIANITAVIACLSALGYEAPAISRAVGQLTPVPGRMQRVTERGARSPLVVVDYAHTPDALEKALATLRQLAGEGSLHVVFGCGGNRDAGKRPIMGGIAARAADHVWVTSDNPRFESPRAIIDQIMAGIPSDLRARTRAVADRAEAIATAIAKAGDDDIVLIAGKGHETYQDSDGVKQPFDDVAQAREALCCV
jgi:UDP-N-acetylmuramoyl-L-alanyl-D-glutamate--2,6-diaminopimelate ligase